MQLTPQMWRRLWPFVLLFLASVMAYFQASGVSELVGASLEPSARPVPPRAPPPALHQQRPPDAKAILDRNPFDSVTGPLGRVPEIELAKKKPEHVDPLHAPECKGLTVSITTESPDPSWSLAVIQGPGEKHGRLRRIGDTVGDKRVAYIGFNRLEQSPTVWLESTSGLCQSYLFDDEPAPAKPKPKPTLKKPPRRPARRVPPAAPKSIADKIHRVSATEFNVDRSVVDTVVEQYSKLLKNVLVRPVQKNGRVVGMRVLRIRPDTLLGKLGLANGDVIQSINGFQLSAPDKALQAYARLRTASNIALKVERKGKPMTIDLHIQ
ncbi:MAG: general secretion pathway protein GspC [Myxococcales bacterium]|nr:general secretion pathway protein GspC [Myxococcales bacterium]MCB9578742.1 general secretion pathway protein GspC [Polyangiaceae bacterium]